MAKMKKEENKQTVEREYIIPLREKCRPVPRYKKTPKAVKTVKEFLVRHMKIRDRDLRKIRIDSDLNEILWFRGIKNPPHKIKVKAIKDSKEEIVRVYAVDVPNKIKFKRLRMEKIEKQAKEISEKKKSLMQKAKESMQKPKEKDSSSEDVNADGVEDKVEEKEKTKAIEEATAELEKAKAKQTQHTTKAKSPKEAKNAQVGYNKSSRGH
ncbi:MAG: 50S ribosomal protein L31e [Candidatus Pacearchaeota archaeon]|jgi:large subunit ribosomal protein L31e